MTFLEDLNDNAEIICIGLAVVAVLLIICGGMYRERVQRMLKEELITLPETALDWWSVSHVILYSVFGFLIPNRHFTFLLLGCGFEIFEDMLSIGSSKKLANCTGPDKDSKLMCKFSINGGYWYAKWDDIFMNMLGYTLGSSFKTSFYPM
jgi:hypothetical protein